MALSAGTRLGPYEILAAIGAGGMGEVYRARDTSLDRDVAIKVLPDAFSTDAERLARFEREAKVLASLNHPNIAAIHGLETSGRTRALVLELVEGPTLADRIAQGRIPLAEALPIARQIAEALEAAHEQGIIHRDLKPANIKVREDGTVKVLDFGLAKLAEPASGRTGPAAVTNSPTLSMQATYAGVILGTAAYMSPEQAAGKAVDKRADLWAFGVVLFEILTGRALFTGESASHVLAAVLTKEPDWSALPADVPPAVRTLLRRCLDKDRKRRLDSALAVRLEIDEALAHTSAEPGGIDVAIPGVGLRRAVSLPIVLGVVVVAVIIGIWVGVAIDRWRGTPSGPRTVTRFSFTLLAAEDVPPFDIRQDSEHSPRLVPGWTMGVLPLECGGPWRVPESQRRHGADRTGDGGLR